MVIIGTVIIFTSPVSEILFCSAQNISYINLTRFGTVCEMLKLLESIKFWNKQINKRTRHPSHQQDTWSVFMVKRYLL